MYISAVRIENFRIFGNGDSSFSLKLRPGLTAIVGENDAGKTAFIDALRLVVGTRDQDTLRLDISDFHHPPAGPRASEIRIRLEFSALTATDRRTFAEYLSYPENPEALPFMVVTFAAKRTGNEGGGRRFTSLEWRTGATGEGPLLDAAARFLLQATYLRPLRDAERALAAGRGSRLSQILQYTKEIKDHGVDFDVEGFDALDPKTLSILGLGDYANHLIETSEGIKKTRGKLNEDYLQPLSFSGDPLAARLRISGHRENSTRLRQLLEKLEVSLAADEVVEEAHTRGLGSNNLLFMACELLLLGAETDGFPLLLIEEPEAHLHPQRQIRLMAFLREQAKKARADGQSIQIIVSTHSPSLAADVQLENLVLFRKGRCHSMAPGDTKLTTSDYRFLQRFLDATKANLFFARGVMIVEGDAENILVPAIAKLIGRDFGEYGVSVVNVGGVGLSRYARIFMRQRPEEDGIVGISVACVTDMDVMPDCAALIMGKIKDGEAIPPLPGSKRKWRIESDFSAETLEEKRTDIRSKASEQGVDTFVANKWTLEYDLAFSGLGKEMYLATALANSDDKISSGKTTIEVVLEAAGKGYDGLVECFLPNDEHASHIYEPLGGENPVSKTIVAQYLVEILQRDAAKDKKFAATLRARLPQYLVNAIVHVTKPVAPEEQNNENDAGDVVVLEPAAAP